MNHRQNTSIFRIPPALEDLMGNYIFQKTENWNMDYGYSAEAGIDTYPRRALLSGSTNALVVNMDVDVDDLDYACSNFQGFQVEKHFSIHFTQVSKLVRDSETI